MRCSDETTQITLQVFYALFCIWMAKVILPQLKESAGRTSRIQGAFVEEFMKEDHETVKLEKHKDDCYSCFFMVLIGGSLGATVGSECQLDISPTCPESLHAGSLLGFGVMMLVYEFLLVSVYHVMMESQRLEHRCHLVIAIQDGSADRVFKALDKNKDGKLQAHELDGYFVKCGINEEPFV